MKTFHHVFVMCVVVFLAWEAAAVEETVTFDRDVTVLGSNNQIQKLHSWTIEVKKVESESDYVSRRTDNEGKKLAIFFFNNDKDALKGDDEKFKVLAAKEFARNEVRNGVYLIVPNDVLTENFRKKHNIRFTNYLWFDLEDKASYDARHNEYEGRSIYTLFHDYQPDCVTESGKNCLEWRKEDTMLWIKNKYNTMCVRTVLLVVHVDVVRPDAIGKLCPKLGQPLEYPALYHEKNSRLIDITGKFSGKFNGKNADYKARDSCFDRNTSMN
ncbi:uncharacterized protein LOC128993935 isoform X2 [Macrosteles quadrilineatus]|uniref:uncharacterized protein LOC128993935 isoform X2 n=1 Tax=Macrosteles quadrilineatus TaxID=74068 RepID=UPI0023E221E2|nr:uncharacterized protein LOC128993935 isoform X2 [Macrosteles quadrilineatus]